ncbi:hypothetical protein, partial [Haladaptatus sp.]|uniref:hypothetical protein n=1 Tax=Haladaptatus sp. TaxID=1973141 RepID=UPI003C670AD6
PKPTVFLARFTRCDTRPSRAVRLVGITKPVPPSGARASRPEAISAEGLTGYRARDERNDW